MICAANSLADQVGVAAINRGAIFRFFTKPWDDESMRHHIREAFHHHSLTYQADNEKEIIRLCS